MVNVHHHTKLHVSPQRFLKMELNYPEKRANDHMTKPKYKNMRITAHSASTNQIRLLCDFFKTNKITKV